MQTAHQPHIPSYNFPLCAAQTSPSKKRKPPVTFPSTGFSVYEGKVTDSGWIAPFLSPLSPPQNTLLGLSTVVSGFSQSAENLTYQVHTCGCERARQVSLSLLSVN